MHRDPPRHGSGRNISTRSRQALARAAREDQGRRPARRGHADGRARQPQPARRRSRRRSPNWKRRARASCRAIPMPIRRFAGGAFMPPVLLRTDDPWGNDAVHDVEAVRAGLDDHAVPRHRRRHRARQPRQGQPCAVAVHPFARRGARVRPGRGGLSWPDAGHRPHQCGRNRPATARRCRCSSTAAPAAPAASEEMGGVRGVKHYMQRTALQSSPGHDRRHHRAICPGRAQALHRNATRSGSR